MDYGVKGVEGKIVCLFFQTAACFTLLENMKIWCKIQVLIYPFYQDIFGKVILLNLKIVAGFKKESKLLLVVKFPSSINKRIRDTPKKETPFGRLWVLCQ